MNLLFARAEDAENQITGGHVAPAPVASPDPAGSPQARARPAPAATTLSVVIPIFDEAANIPELYRRLTDVLAQLGMRYELIFVNDGSRDEGPALLRALYLRDPRVVLINLSRNFGHQPAISAGIDHAIGDGVIVMDGDLQDPPEVLPDLVAAWRNGYDVVYAVRTERKEHLIKRMGYAVFYRALRAMSDLDIPLDSGDFGLMDRKVVDELRRLPERARFVRGLRAFVGFRQIGLLYARDARFGGTSKYSLRALIRLATDGLISFSSYPLHLATYLGLIVAALAAALAIWVCLDAVYNRATPRGWASTLVIILFMGGLQLLSLGVIGEYMRRIFLETKGRPTYIVDTIEKQGPDRERPVTSST